MTPEIIKQNIEMINATIWAFNLACVAVTLTFAEIWNIYRVLTSLNEAFTPIDSRLKFWIFLVVPFSTFLYKFIEYVKESYSNYKELN